MKNLKWYERLRWVSSALLVSSIILISIYWAAHRYFASEYANSLPIFILKELGMAGFVALILNISIEWVNRARHVAHQNSLLEELEKKHVDTSKRLLTDVNEQLFQTVYKRNIDSRVFDQVEKHLLKASTMRRDFEVHLTLEPFLKNGNVTEFVKITLINKYKLVNLTNDAISGSVLSIVVDITPDHKEQCKFKCLVVGDTRFEEPDLDKMVVENQSTINLKYAHSIPANDSIEISVSYEKLAPLDYNEVIITTISLDNLKLSVVDPQNAFTVSTVSLHPEDGIRKSPIDQKYLTNWEIESPVLPGQGIVVMWYPNTPKKTQPIQALQAN